MDAKLKNALADARRGSPILPLHSVGSNGRCTCSNLDCRSCAKHPDADAVPHGLHQATLDPGKIRRWLDGREDRNYGRRTDRELVADVDPRNGGFETLERLIEKHGPLPRTPRAETGSDGWHICFARPIGITISSRQNALGPGIDIKCGPRAYVVGPGSLHASGKRYAWHDEFHPDDTPLALPPAWVLDAAVTPPPTRPKPFRPRTDDDQRICNALLRIPADDRDTWWKIGAALKSHFGDAGRTLWDQWSATSEKYDPRTQERIWRSFRRGGVTIATIFHFAKEHARAA